MVSEDSVRKRNLKDNINVKDFTNHRYKKRDDIDIANDDIKNTHRNLEPESDSYYLTRIVLVRFIAFIYGYLFFFHYLFNYLN